MNDDAELIRRYVDDHSDAAFIQLVERHIGMVHATALRRLGGDRQLAEDVAQSVFFDLARKASSLRHRSSLAGWLYWSAHAASAAVVRRERRRKARELKAHHMGTTLPTNDLPPDWEKLRPVLDDAVTKLAASEREAIVLRFFQRCSFADVGRALELSEEAARKRVDRSLDKLRRILIGQGIASTTSALGSALLAAGPEPLSIAFSQRIATHASGTRPLLRRSFLAGSVLSSQRS